MTSQTLPPKMAQQFAKRAAAEDYEFCIPGTTPVYIWFQGNTEICLIGIDGTTGHITKRSSQLTESKKAELAAYGHRVSA